MMNLVTMRFLGEPINLNDIYHQWLGVRLDSDPQFSHGYVDTMYLFRPESMETSSYHRVAIIVL